jgi:hypothetical protein
VSKVGCDISSYQGPVDNSYQHPWLTFRDTDPAYAASSPDPTAAHNAAWCRQALADGRLDGWTTYAVYEPGYNQRIMAYLEALGDPIDHVMIDVESWGGVITGDHSAEINQLATMLAARYPGLDKHGEPRVWGYANGADMATEWPNHVSWLPIVIAKYGGAQPVYPNMIGWQYTNGQYVVQGLPNSSPPFGACDHNLYLMSSPEGIDMPLTDTEAVEVLNAARAINARIAGLDRDSAAIADMLPAVAEMRGNVQNIVKELAAPLQAQPVDVDKLATALTAHFGSDIATVLGNALIKGGATP